ncbi:MAG TPA: hypothetical protein VF212_15355 [Longimicrobiales bacterium]
MTILDAVGAAASVDGATFQVWEDGREQVPVVVSITAGDPTIKLFGRVTAGDEWVELLSVNSTTGQLVPRFPQMYAALTFGTLPADARVSIDARGVAVA